MFILRTLVHIDAVEAIPFVASQALAAVASNRVQALRICIASVPIAAPNRLIALVDI